MVPTSGQFHTHVGINRSEESVEGGRFCGLVDERNKTQRGAAYEVMQSSPFTGLAICASFPHADVSVS